MEAARQSTSGGPLVLVADHERLYRWFAIECLEGAGRRALPFAAISDMLTYLDHAREDLIILVDEQSLRDERLDPADVLRHASSVRRMYVLADVPEEVRLGACGHAVVSKPCDRDALVALVN